MSTRRARLASTSASASPAPTILPTKIPTLAKPASSDIPQLQELRHQWKWAAFSQFYYTFAPLFAMDDVSLTDIEEDLINSTMIFLPRVMQRLLITLSQDRKITTENWQTALRRQYKRRDPEANPIGWEPVIPRNSRSATVESDLKSEPDVASANESDHTDDEQKKDIVKDEVVDVKMSEKEADAPDSTQDLSNDNVDKVKDFGRLPSKEGDGVNDGTTDPLKDWADLSMLEKLETMHTLLEWHFQNPLRLRNIMRSDDENASWRIEPIGYDAKRNAYWLIGSDRLWLQRSPPKPPKKATKRKAATNGGKRKAKAPRIEAEEDEVFLTPSRRDVTRRTSKGVGNSRAASQRNTRGSHHKLEEEITSSPGGRGSRAAKTQANAKLDLQAKQLAAAKAEMEMLNRKSKSPSKKSSTRRSLGTRVSKRLRGDDDEEDDDDEWQQVPKEWLMDAGEEEEEVYTPSKTRGTRSSARIKSNHNPVPPARNKRQLRNSMVQKTGLESSDESDLTELSDSDDADATPEAPTTQEQQEEPNAIDPENGVTAEGWPPSDFVEWETVCVSLQEWEAIPQRFEKATNYLEKALYKFLVNEVIPYVTETLREIEKLRQKEEALMNRKRSSRLAIRESEKEAARAAAEKRAEEEERMARARRVEARARKEEEERLKREQAREQRRKEREERELARSRRLEESRNEEKDETHVVHGVDTKKNPITNDSKVHSHSQPTKKFDMRQKLISEDWELDCEVCGAKGINKDDGLPLMSCEKCNKWQHIPCHDMVDRKAGKRARNWDVVEFICKCCSSTTQGTNGPARVPNHDRGTNGYEHFRVQSPYYSNSGNDIVPANSRKMANYPQEQGPSTFTGFAHYHPQQRGFSAQPTNQTQCPTHSLSHPSLSHPFSAQRVPSWNERAPQPYPVNGTLSHQHPLPYMTPTSYAASGSSDMQHMNTTTLNGSSSQQPSQNGQYPHVLPIHPQHQTYNNQTTHHTQV